MTRYANDMATGLLVPVEQYLSTSYSPDRDYVDGEVLERNLGELPHSGTQTLICIFFGRRYPHLGQRVFTEQRVQVKATRYRIPDVCVIREGAPRTRITRTPPLLCIEILSRGDTIAQTMQRIDDYLAMGVEVCWLIDPDGRKAWTATEPGRLVAAEDNILRAPGIEMPLEEVLPLETID